MHNFLLIQKQKDEEIASLDTLIKSNPDPRELKRALAVKMAIEGQAHQKIAQLLGVSQYFITDWKKAFKISGIEGLKLGYKGTKKYLTDEQISETIEWLTNKKYWQLDELVNYLEEKYDVVYKSKQSYYDLFSTAQISWKRSQKTNPKFDEELVKKKREEINAFLSQNQSQKINCILFAPNAPQQNPVEDVWLQAKNFLRKYWHLCQSFRAIKVLFEFFTDQQKFDFPKIDRYQPAR
jgi:transposase